MHNFYNYHLIIGSSTRSSFVPSTICLLAICPLSALWRCSTACSRSSSNRLCLMVDCRLFQWCWRVEAAVNCFSRSGVNTRDLRLHMCAWVDNVYMYIYYTQHSIRTCTSSIIVISEIIWFTYHAQIIPYNYACMSIKLGDFPVYLAMLHAHLIQQLRKQIWFLYT